MQYVVIFLKMPWNDKIMMVGVHFEYCNYING